jgi:chemotaxis protein methyltransferase CheR
MSEAVAIASREFRLLRDLIADTCGFYVGDERATAVGNRLLPRLAATGCRSFLDYYLLLKYDGGNELDQALELVLNHETYFFRESAQLDAVARIAADADPAKRFRVLSAGCSTGEEPYSLAMLLDQQRVFEHPAGVDIVAIDVSERVLTAARAAGYGGNSFRGGEGRFLDWYFTPDEGLLRLDERLRLRVSFARVNLLDCARLAGMGPFDVVMCRNVVIYYREQTKRRVIAGLGDALVEGGHLFLGHSESLYGVSNEFEMVEIGDSLAYRRPVVD